MKFEEMMALIEAMGCDADCVIEDGCIFVDIHDFEGFDDDWSEVMRKYEHPEAVRAFEKAIERGVRKDWEDEERWFDGFCVSVHYDSYDI